MYTFCNSILFSMQTLLLLAWLLFQPLEAAVVEVGADVLVKERLSLLRNKKIGLITNQTAVNNKYQLTVDLLKEHAKDYKIVALFAPEHGFYGQIHANDSVDHETDGDGIPIYSLHGETMRPTKEMLKGIDLLIFDIQDIGSRSYTYITTLFYVMEEASKAKIPVMVLDRPNPINGVVVDGPMLDPALRTIVGYINVPYCYGMTVGELARYFNEEYQVGCKLEVIPMHGWRRTMSHADTGIPWIPTSPHIPEADTPLYYPVTGILGEVSIVNIGVGYTLPFKLIGAPWIDALALSETLNAAHFQGVHFSPFYFKPFYGKYKGENCQGVLIHVDNPLKYKPVSIQFLLLSTLKTLYPKQFTEGVEKNKNRQSMFCKIVGSAKAWAFLSDKNHSTKEFRTLHELEKRQFLEKRKKYLIPSYNGDLAL